MGYGLDVYTKELYEKEKKCIAVREDYLNKKNCWYGGKLYGYTIEEAVYSESFQYLVNIGVADEDAQSKIGYKMVEIELTQKQFLTFVKKYLKELTEYYKNDPKYAQLRKKELKIFSKDEENKILRWW
jgi:hypothetical protein